MASAESIYVKALIVLTLVFVAGGLCDLVLYLEDQETISEWLKAHSGWFWWPAAVLATFMVGLGLHLFVLPVKWGGTP